MNFPLIRLESISNHVDTYNTMKDFRIYSKDETKQKRLSKVYYLFWTIGLALLGFYGFMFWNLSYDFSTDHKLWVETFTILSAIMSFIGFGGLVISFDEGQKATRKANTLSVCIEIFKELRSYDFLSYEKIILKKLPNETEVKKISKIEDPELRYAIKSYLNIINNISAMVIHNVVDDEPIIAYKGIGILYFFELLKPYIDISRDELHKQVVKNEKLSKDTKAILEEATLLNYAHYELFVQQIKAKSPRLICEFNSKLIKE